METYVFEKRDYIELFSHFGISVFRFDNFALSEMYRNIPAIVVTYRDEYVNNLNDIPTFNRSIRDILLHFYKAQAYEHFQRGETWRGTVLENAVSEAFYTLVGDDIWHKATNGNWFTRWNTLSFGEMGTLTEAELEAALRASREAVAVTEPYSPITAMGTMQFMGSNGAGVSDSSLVMTLTISTQLTNIPSGWNRSREYSKSRLVLSEAVALGERLPTWKQLYENNQLLISAFLHQAQM